MEYFFKVFKIRPAQPNDLANLHRLATSLSAHGFLTLPVEKGGLEDLISLSTRSFEQRLDDPDQGRYLFVLEDADRHQAVGSSLIVARHGTPASPHLYLQVDSEKRTLLLRSETEGRTELGGLILDATYRRHPARLGKRLSYVRLLYIRKHPDLFKRRILAELLPPFTADGKSPLWESLGRRVTGLDYREADRRSRMDKGFVFSTFPKEAIPIPSLSPEAQAVLGVPGPETQAVAKMLTEAGFRYLHQVDPFDGGPHFGAEQTEIRRDVVENFLLEETEIRIEIGGL